MYKTLKIYSLSCLTLVVCLAASIFFYYSKPARINAEIDNSSAVINSNFVAPASNDALLTSSFKRKDNSDLSTVENSTATNRIAISENDTQSSFAEIMQDRPVDSEVFESCEGNWLEIPSLNKVISLEYSSIPEWNESSQPSVLVETKNNTNKVIIGHNICQNGNCFSPTTDFGQIINLKQGESVKACIDGKLLTKQISVSAPMEDTSTYILDNWLGESSITLFTCYGECYDSSCSSTKQRWVIGAI